MWCFFFFRHTVEEVHRESTHVVEVKKAETTSVKEDQLNLTGRCDFRET